MENLWNRIATTMEQETTGASRTRNCMFKWTGEDLPTEISYAVGCMTYLGYIKQGTTITGYVEFDMPLRPGGIKKLLTGKEKGTNITLTRYKQGTIIEKRARAEEHVKALGEIITHGKLKKTAKNPYKKRIYKKRKSVSKGTTAKETEWKESFNPMIDMNHCDAPNHRY